MIDKHDKLIIIFTMLAELKNRKKLNIKGFKMEVGIIRNLLASYEAETNSYNRELHIQIKELNAYLA